MSLADMEHDLTELRRLLETALRERSRTLLLSEIQKLETEISKEKTRQHSAAAAATSSDSTSLPAARTYTVQLSAYAWDQTDRFMKFYVQLPDAHSCSTSQVKCRFTEHTLSLLVENCAGKNYNFTINNLLNPIVPNMSSYKLKTDSVLIMAKKAVEGVHWACVTGQEKILKDLKEDKRKPKLDEKADPSASLMSLLKNMYDEGDDEMKRTIAKAWTESREKSAPAPGLAADL